MKSISVFCGSSLGRDPEFLNAARHLGKTLAEKDISLVYGGSKVGIMGVVADAALDCGGRVIGVLPRLLQRKEISHTGLTELILCETMHERKMKMFERSEGFIALPGGFGTLEEVVEILTWQQLGLHQFPIGFLNVRGFYNHLQLFFEQMVNSELLKPEHRTMAIFEDSVPALLQRMGSYQAPPVPKWLSEEST